MRTFNRFVLDCRLRAPFGRGAAAFQCFQESDDDALVLYRALGPLRRLCLLYTSDAADDTPCVDLGGRRILKKKK